MSRKIINYYIVCGNITGIQNEVEEFLRAGWELQGGASTVTDHPNFNDRLFAQAMIKRSTPKKKR